jgi:O-antigen/teichoic acid export membrane protein
MGLKQKAVVGLLWSFGQQFSSQIISFSISIILARILSPSEFGLIGMLSIFIGLSNTLMDSGMTSSLIRTQNADQKDYSTIFVLNMLGSISLYIIIFFSAPYIANFYGHPILKDVVRIYSLTFVFSAFMGVQSAKMTKEMNFRLQMLIQIPSIVLGGILGITLAYNGFGVWSLVYMYVFQGFLSSALHWIYSGWRPQVKFYPDKFQQHFGFGYKMMLSSLITTIYDNLFTIIIGKYYSAAQLGFYSRALALRQMPVSNLSAALRKVTYPLFSSINHDNFKLKDVYKRLIQQVIFWIVPLLTLLIVIAEPFIRFLFTEKWLPAVPYFQILCVTGMLLPLQNYNINIIKVKGHSGIILKIQAAQRSFGILGILLVIPYGIYGLLYFQLFATIVDYNIGAYFGGRMINYSIVEQVKDIFASVSLAVIIGFCTGFLDRYLDRSFSLPDISRLVIASLFYFSIYLSLSSLLKLPAVRDFRELILKK